MRGIRLHLENDEETKQTAFVTVPVRGIRLHPNDERTKVVVKLLLSP